MKLLLTTIKTDNSYTEYSMKSLYSVVVDSPLDVEMKMYDRCTRDDEIYGDIVMNQYNIVYFHCDEYNEERISNLVEMVKKAAQSTAVVVGGMQVSVGTASWMKANPWVDYVIRGEGEVALFSFLKSVYSYEFEFENIPGLAYRNGDQIAVNSMDEFAEMEDLPFVYEINDANAEVITYETMRGNSEKSSYDQFIPNAAIRSLSLARICRELRYFLVKEPKKVVFFDKCFNYNSERAYRIFEYLMKNDNGVTAFEFNISGENLDDETVRLLSDAREGLFIFNIDVASTNPEILAAVGHKENVYQLMYNVTKLLQTGKVECHFTLVAGLPHETEELFARSFNKAYGLCDGAPLTIVPVRLVKGSRLRHESDSLGYEYTFRSPYDVISSDSITAVEMIGIRNLSRVVKAYIGDGGFKTSVPRMLNDTGMKPYELFSRLSTYIFGNKYEKNLCDKAELARYLRAFAADFYKDIEDTVKFDILSGAIHADLARAVSEADLTKFERDGWDIER